MGRYIDEGVWEGCCERNAGQIVPRCAAWIAMLMSPKDLKCSYETGLENFGKFFKEQLHQKKLGRKVTIKAHNNLVIL
jgi:hypothetical protein